MRDVGLTVQGVGENADASYVIYGFADKRDYDVVNPLALAAGQWRLSAPGSPDHTCCENSGSHWELVVPLDGFRVPAGPAVRAGMKPSKTSLLHARRPAARGNSACLSTAHLTRKGSSMKRIAFAIRDRRDEPDKGS
jgi:hypothetical protein